MVANVRTLKLDYNAYQADKAALKAGLLMRRNGMAIDSDEVWSTYKDLHREAKGLLDTLGRLAPGVNPDSGAQLHKLIWQDLGCLPPPELPDKILRTKTGELSTGKLVIAALTKNMLVEFAKSDEGRFAGEFGDDKTPAHPMSVPNDEAFRILQTLVQYSKVKKMQEMTRAFMTGQQIEMLNRVLHLPKSKRYKPKGLIYPDGKVHPSFVPKTLNGRYASSDPNAQQLNKLLKRFFRKRGWKWVQADYDQIHVRIQANQWRIKRLLHVLESGEDPHLSTMGTLLGRSFVEQTPGFVDWMTKPPETSPCHELRQMGKIINYGAAYGAGAKVLYGQILKDLNAFGVPSLWRTELDQLLQLLQARKENEPDWGRHYSAVRREWRTRGYLESEGTKRRFECRSGKVTELYNCTVLGFEADLVGHITREVADRWPDWLCNQTHDALALFVPAQVADTVAEELTEQMTVFYAGHPIIYSAEASVSDSLSGKDVPEWAA